MEVSPAVFTADPYLYYPEGMGRELGRQQHIRWTSTHSLYCHLISGNSVLTRWPTSHFSALAFIRADHTHFSRLSLPLWYHSLLVVLPSRFSYTQPLNVGIDPPSLLNCFSRGSLGFLIAKPSCPLEAHRRLYLPPLFLCNGICAFSPSLVSPGWLHLALLSWRCKYFNVGLYPLLIFFF